MTRTVTLLDLIHERLEAEELPLPVFSPIAAQLQALAADENFSMDEVERVILSDQVLASEVLRAGNSPFFSGLSAIKTVRGAVVRLGIQQVIHLVLLATERNKYRADDPGLARQVRDLWRHAVGCSLGAQWLVRRLGYRELEQEAFIGGLVHDIGKLFLLRTVDDLMRERSGTERPSPELLEELLATMHTEIGARLLERWNLPDLYSGIARDHHAEDYPHENVPLVAVRLANLACNKLGIGPGHDPSIVLPATTEAAALGVRDVLLAELEIMLEDHHELTANDTGTAHAKVN
jgi:HD-like signal output (HDOD) protein